MPARLERVSKASHLSQRGSAIRRVVLADRMDQADIGERRSSKRTTFGFGQGEGDWVLAIGPTMAATRGEEGESLSRPSGQRERGSPSAAAKPREGGGWSRIHGRESDRETSERGKPCSGRLDRTSSKSGTRDEGNRPR